MNREHDDEIDRAAFKAEAALKQSRYAMERRDRSNAIRALYAEKFGNGVTTRQVG